MSAEEVIYPLLSPLVQGRVYPNRAPSGSALPRIVYQQVGGVTVDFLEGTLPDKENARMQIVCWAATLLEAIALIKAAEDLLMAAPHFQVQRLGARVSGDESDTNLYSSMQDFSIWTAR